MKGLDFPIASWANIGILLLFSYRSGLLGGVNPHERADTRMFQSFKSLGLTRPAMPEGNMALSLTLNIMTGSLILRLAQ